MKAIFISARTGASRLPNKTILKIKDKHTIEYVIGAVEKSRLADKIILCTTTLTEDDILCEIANSNGIEYFRGSPLNKLVRWSSACNKFNISFFATADGDDLFYDAGLADLCFQQGERFDIISGQGLYNDVYGIRAAALEKITRSLNEKIVEPHDLIDFLKSQKQLAVGELTKVPDLYKKKNMRLTLDYEEDFDFFKEVICKLPRDFSLKDAITYIENNESVRNINLFRENDWKNHQKTK
jgi:spore coat polysaccharide biosynthesis protein SpsF